MENIPILTAIVFLPFLGAAVIALFLRNNNKVRIWSLCIVLIELLLCLILFFLYERSHVDQFQFVDKSDNWINFSKYTLSYHLGVDGISLPLVLLNGILGVVAVMVSWKIELKVPKYFALLLVLQGAVMGVFTSLDLILFFIFWEIELLPMYFLISQWGSGKKEYSAMKFLIFTFLGSAFMFVGIIAVALSVGSFNIDGLSELVGNKDVVFIMSPAVIFALLFVGFAVKLPVWPIHTWLPDAHTDAPTAASVMLAGVLLKMGGYGIIRLCVSLFPEVMFDGAGHILVVAGVVNVIYGALITLRQTDLKRLIAFSSISHMGLVLIGISSLSMSSSNIGLTGASMQMFTHGTITGLMFLVVGYIYEKTHTRYIPDLGGLATKMPIISIVFVVAGLASLGLPGTSGFVSELLVLVGTFPIWQWYTGIAAFGIVITAGYILWMIERTLFGEPRERFSDITDANAFEMIPMFLLLFVIIAVGIYPSIISDLFKEGSVQIIQNAASTVK